MADDIKNLDEKGERNSASAGQGQPADPAPFFSAKVEKHDDEKKKDHYRTRINQHLNDADEIGIERHEEPGETEERNHQAQGACHGIGIANDGDAEDQHQKREDPKEKLRHYTITSNFELRIWQFISFRSISKQRRASHRQFRGVFPYDAPCQRG